MYFHAHKIGTLIVNTTLERYSYGEVMKTNANTLTSAQYLAYAFVIVSLSTSSITVDSASHHC